jgi:hypothetical protein
VLPRLGFLGPRGGWLARPWRSPVRSRPVKRRAQCRHQAAGSLGKKSRGSVVRWGMTGGSRLSAARALGERSAGRWPRARVLGRASAWAAGYARAGPCRSGAQARVGCWAARCEVGPWRGGWARSRFLNFQPQLKSF